MLATLLLVACGSDAPQLAGHTDDDSTGDASTGHTTSSGSAPSATLDDELPWEVITEQHETVLPYVYYADASQNEQVMPHTVNGHSQIDRLVYPTFGNPNLYLRDDDADSLLVVLRIEDSVLAHLAPEVREQVPNKNRNYLSLTQDSANKLAVYLVPRSGREDYTALAQVIPGAGQRLHAITPTEIQIDPIAPDLPEALSHRRTVRLVFRKDALSQVPAALYDLRLEVLKGGRAALGDDGKPAIEWQYNAVSLYDSAPDEYSILNITDTQISMADVQTGDSRTHLQNFVDYVNTSTDPGVKGAQFITFNGDLHNGGSILTVRQREVAHTYMDEAAFALGTLRELRKPMFLTAGNHDGYAATGIAPGVVVSGDSAVGTSLDDIVNEVQPSPWPNFSIPGYQAYRNAVASTPGGFANDLFVGSFIRHAGERTYAKAFEEIPIERRNMVLYDGFHQWQRSYGSLNYSFQFKKNHYVSVNSYDLRQHVRAGWGMYTVNYGGGLSAVQEEWLRRDLASHTDDDVILFAHHDPRGGHEGVDRGYYFAQLGFHNLQQSMTNYLMQEVWNPSACSGLPEWARAETTTDEECVHDGLQEFMGPDLKFDCAADAKDETGACRTDLMQNADEHAYRFGAYQFVDIIAKTPNLRTMLLGHTHMNTLEVLRHGQNIVPVQFTDEQLRGFASLEVQNPARGYAWQSELSGQTPADYDPNGLTEDQIEARMQQLRTLYEGAAKGNSQTLEGDDQRELLVLRTTCNAVLTSQEDLAGDKAVGFAVLNVSRQRDGRNVDLPQVNRARYFEMDPDVKFHLLGEVAIPRTTATDQASPNNPLNALYQP